MPSRGKHEDTARTIHTSKDTLDILVRKICQETQLLDATVRDLFSKGWEWQEGRFQKHRPVRINNY